MQLTRERFQDFLLLFFFVILFSPIFISLDISSGIHFDAYYWNKYKYPSIPISSLIIILVGLFNIKSILKNKHLVIFTLLLSLLTIYNFFNGLNRILITSFGLLIFLYSYEIFLTFKLERNKFIKYIFYSLSIMIIIKFCFDIYLYSAILDRSVDIFTESKSVTYRATYGVLINQTLPTVTMFYITPKIAIYNYFTYFSFVYFFTTVLAVYFLFEKKMFFLPILMIIISLLAVHDIDSRLFTYGIYFIPLIYAFQYLLKLKINMYFYIFLGIYLFITLCVGLIDFDISSIGNSLRGRYLQWHSFFDGFTFLNIFLGYTNNYRFELKGSLHNEFLEIFSFIGILTFYYIYLLKRIFLNVHSTFFIISILLMFIIFSGACFQLNILNPYIAIILAISYASISLKDSDKYE